MSATILNLRRAEYLWKALALLAISGVVYLSQRPTDPPSGSTWQGYVLGSIGAALIVWLSLLGVRKRQYGAAGQLREWVSAHIYFGLALIGVVLLHSGGQLGWNVHTLSFVLMVVVVLSGIVGTALFVLVPERLSRVRQGRSSAALYVECNSLMSSACSSHAAARQPLNLRSAAASREQSSAAVCSTRFWPVTDRHSLVARTQA